MKQKKKKKKHRTAFPVLLSLLLLLRVLKSPPFAQCQYLRTVEEGAFDVVIVDSSDPVGPAAALFEAPFFALVHRALRPGGILCMQGECVWLHLDLIGASMHAMHDVGFAEVDYAWCSVPTYPSGQIGFVVCRKAGHVPPTGARPTSAEQAFGAGIVSVSRPSRPIGDDVAPLLRYYSPRIHRAAFILPTFAERVVAPGRKSPLRHSAGRALPRSGGNICFRSFTHGPPASPSRGGGGSGDSLDGSWRLGAVLAYSITALVLAGGVAAVWAARGCGPSRTRWA